jgi:DNA-binding transcriptional regulator YhcF (GntR family)
MSGAPSTRRHYIVLKAIRSFMESRKATPTMKEISIATGINKATVYFYFQKLIDEGLVYRAKHSRTIELTGTSQFMKLPTQAPVRSRSARRAEQRTAQRISKPTKDEEAAWMDAAVELGKKNDMRASREYAMHDRLSLFSRGGIRGAKMG